MKNQNQQPTPTSHEQTEAKAEVIKLGIDVHQRRYVVVSQTDNEMMRSSRGFDPEEFVVWAERLKKRGRFITFVVCMPAHPSFWTELTLYEARCRLSGQGTFSSKMIVIRTYQLQEIFRILLLHGGEEFDKLIDGKTIVYVIQQSLGGHTGTTKNQGSAKNLF